MSKSVQLVLMVAMLLLSVSVVSADYLNTNRLNYYNASDSTLNRTLAYVYTGTGTANISVNLSAPFNFTVNDDCGVAQPAAAVCVCSSAARTAECQNVSTQALFAIQPTFFTFPEYHLSIASGNSTSGAGASARTTTNVTFLRIRDDEIFHTLVEFGRGRGNYFFDSLGRTSSAGMGTGYPYVPNATKFELNYLHKIFNIKQYYSLSTATAENASWRCAYPNNTIVRTHLTTAILRTNTFNVTYKVPEIEGSFERQGYSGQQFDEPESVAVGNSFNVNCSNMIYQLPQVGGNITVDRDAFRLTFRDINPFNISATTPTSQIGNGTQLVDITYTITNLELYPVDDVRLELAAPRFSRFVNTKGEIEGTSLDKYIFERTRMAAGASENIKLTARFVTSGSDASGVTAVNLSGTSVFEFIPPWEVNAYNPVQYIQSVNPTANLSVNLTVNSTVVDLLDTVSIINATVQNIYTTVLNINFTLNFVQNTVYNINATVLNLNFTVSDINQTVQSSNIDTVDVSGTLFTPEDIIIVDALFRTSAGVPIAQASCNLSLMNSTLVEIVSNATMTETNISGFPHYVYNATNISALNGGRLGKFFGHVRCKDGNKPAVFAEADFEVRESTVTTDLTSVLNRLSRMQDFDEEMVFLITDSFGLRDQAREDQIAGRNEDAISKLAKASSQLGVVADRLTTSRDQLLSSSAAPQAYPANAPEVGSTFDLSTESYLWAAIVVLGAILIYTFKREHVHEPEF